MSHFNHENNEFENDPYYFNEYESHASANIMMQEIESQLEYINNNFQGEDQLTQKMELAESMIERYPEFDIEYIRSLIW